MKQAKYMMGYAVAGLMAGMVALSALTPATSASATEVSTNMATERAAPKCLDGRHTGRIHVVDKNTFLAYDSWGNPYKMGYSGPCRGMDDYSKFGFEFKGTSQICQAHDAMLLRSENNGPLVKCIITSFEPISRAEADTLDPDFYAKAKK
ncbi:MAG: hypothetical protein WBQ60_11825 [Asticcacaulis sp.]